MDAALKVTEVFYSIQGESSYAGWPCIFIRLAGCNLRCSYCDTTYAYEEGEELRIQEIIEAVKRYQCTLVEVTGGEPLLQTGTPALIRSLLQENYHVLLETNGSQDISTVSQECVRIIDFKCPGSGMGDANRFENIRLLGPKDELKFVIGDREDFAYAQDMLRIVRAHAAYQNVVHFSPVSGRLDPRQLAEWILNDRLPVHLQLQLHKIIWPFETRGV